jgi:hypothetical protein
VLSALYGAWELVRRAVPAWNPWWFAGLAILLVAPVRALNDEAKLDYPMPYQNYFRLGEFAKANVPADAQFATTKPALWYLFAERKATRIPTEADPAQFMLRLKEEGLNYVVVDQLGYGSVGRYFVPAYQAYPERFELVAQLPNPDTYIFKVK